MRHIRETIAANLAAFDRAHVERADLRRAAVAILLSVKDEVLTYVLTRRAAGMRRGAGNYALPGGGVEPGEDAVAAAIREVAEELGVTIARDSALGLLDDFVTLTGHVVTPVVLWADEPLVLSPDPTEVARAWLAPLADLDHPEAPQLEPRAAHPRLRTNFLTTPSVGGCGTSG